MADTDVSSARRLAEPIMASVPAWRFQPQSGGCDEGVAKEHAAANALRALMSAPEARDPPAGEHSEAVSQLVWRTARAMGRSDSEAAHTANVALVHGIGGLAIPDAILLKQGPLTDREWHVMCRHSHVGAAIVASVQALGHLARAVRAEHERWDGCGYPHNLAGEAISTVSRLVLACDADQAMPAQRPHRAAMAPGDALDERHANAGSKLDRVSVVVLVAAVVSARGGAGALGIGRARRVPAPPPDPQAATLPAGQKPTAQSPPLGRPLTQHDNDEQLAATGAVDVLYRRNQHMVYRYCLGVLRNPEAAADAAQSTWMKVTVALSVPDRAVRVRNMRAWLRAIARNECLDTARAGQAAQTQDISGLELAAGTTTETAYEIREQLQSLLVDLETLSKRQRSAIVLRELCGLNSAQLAEEFQTTPQRASGLVADARRTLAQRRSGRLLDCAAVCEQLLQGAQRTIGVRAHLEICMPCNSFAVR